jgi:hypothetical protein
MENIPDDFQLESRVRNYDSRAPTFLNLLSEISLFGGMAYSGLIMLDVKSLSAESKSPETLTYAFSAMVIGSIGCYISERLQK